MDASVKNTPVVPRGASFASVSAETIPAGAAQSHPVAHPSDMQESFGEVLERHQGIGPGFDFLRLFLAAAVLLTHSTEITKQGRLSVVADNGLLFQSRLAVVPAFFALSGFLVAASIFRVRSVPRFLCLRGLRIFPALTVEITLSALILGPLVTSLPLVDYVRSPELYHYLANVCGWNIHYQLPGVFKDNAMDKVNGSLWTVPSEMLCYASLATLMAAQVVFSRARLAATFVGSTVLAAIYLLVKGATPDVSPTNWPLLVLCFYAGVILHAQRAKIPKSNVLFLASLLLFLLVVTIAPALLDIVGPISIAYATVYVGLTPIFLPKLLRTGDYSYGIYLYGFPVQQMIVWAVTDTWSWEANFAVAAPVTLAVAAASWHVIEKPCLKLRRYLVGPSIPSDPETREMIAEASGAQPRG
jgi:peptidoglycan/LPS O-acetylase OafA/YrhL